MNPESLNAGSLNPESLNPESLNPETGAAESVDVPDSMDAGSPDLPDSSDASQASDVPNTSEALPVAEVTRLRAVMHRLRAECPWDAEQTHRSLVHYLVEETCEVVDAIESGADADLVEELGDLLLQVVFHAEIAAEDGRFDLEAVAGGIADKLVRRHPYVFTDSAVPADLDASWEHRKRAEKGRKSSLEGIPETLSAAARASKVISRARSHGVPVDLPEEPITAEETGEAILALVARARASGVDPEQATRDALRTLEQQIRRAEA